MGYEATPESSWRRPSTFKETIVTKFPMGS
jgi:hypothetical protein